MLIDINWNVKIIDYNFNLYHVIKAFYIENYCSKYTYDFKNNDNTHSIIVVNQRAYKKINFRIHQY